MKIGPPLSRWKRFKLRVEFLLLFVYYLCFPHDKKTCRAAVCEMCKRYLA